MLLATAEPFTDPTATREPPSAAPVQHVNGRATALQLFQANQALAHFVAGKMQAAAVSCRLDFDDLVQACLQGLWRAAQLFRPELGWKFSTYAHNACWTHGQRLLDVQRRQLQGWATTQDLGVHERDTAFLDTMPARPEGDCPHSDQAEARALLRPLLDALPARLRLVIDLRFGLTDEGVRTLEEVGQVLGVTRERVRQLEHDALRQLLRANRLAKERRGREMVPG